MGVTQRHRGNNDRWPFSYNKQEPLFVVVTMSSMGALRNEAKTKVVPSVFWADAICINQQNNYEKSHQVRMMGSIYSQASGVIS